MLRCRRRQEKYGEIVLPRIAKGQDGRVSEELCASAVELANALDASAIFVRPHDSSETISHLA